MSVSNTRFRDPNSVHHLVSRIAHRVFFLKEEERNDFIGMMRRAAEFCGIRLIGWCVMTNHFHILAYLPFPEFVDDDEVRRRYIALKGKGAVLPHDREELNKLRARMYSIGEYMKILKQWFTQEYNRRNSHVGTLWETAYHDQPVKQNYKDLVCALAYIHLNPIRASVSSKFDDYAWSSFSAAVKGDALAIKGLRFVYGEDESLAAIFATHRCVMNDLLEGEKRRRAEAIARKRAAGYRAPSDPLTDEAYVAQAAAHLEKVIAAGIELAEQRTTYRKSAAKREKIERQIVDVIRSRPKASILEVANSLAIPQATVYCYVADLKKRGVLTRENRGGAWQIVELQISGQT